ncbi:MAG: CHRD domain-containing protein [Thermomicrobiales bacterium]|nr:CHRD domain-containing protein [Thermomicrobiales bacterium]
MAINHTSGAAGSSSRTAQQFLKGSPFRVLASFTILTTLFALVLNAAAQDSGTPSASPQATPSAAFLRIELPLKEENESDLGGKVTLYEFGDQTIVEFAAEGAGGNHPAAIISGTCAEPTNMARYDLNSVSNTGESSTTIDVALDDLLASDHIVQIFMSPDEADTAIACATIEGEPGLDTGATPEASPQASPAASPAATDVEDLTGVGGETTANTLTVDLQDWSDTGVTGTAILTDNGTSTTVSIQLDGDAVTGGHTVHIHNGTCASPGSATYTLTPIGTDGSSVSTVNLKLATLTNGAYFINVHPDEEHWEEWMVCGNITAAAGTLTGTTTTTTTQTGTGGNQTGDGSSGGNTTTSTTTAQAGSFPQQVGVGDGLRWPSETRDAVVWAVAISGVVLLTTGMFIRHAEKSGKSPRFTRLGL